MVSSPVVFLYHAIFFRDLQDPPPTGRNFTGRVEKQGKICYTVPRNQEPRKTIMLEILLYAGRAIMPLLLTMALGCWLRRSAHWSDDFYRQLNSFCFHVLLPVQLFLNVYAIEDLSVLNWRLLGFIVLCIVGAAGLGVAVAPLFARERAQRVVIAQATFRANQVIMGIPLASALGGQDALIFASLVTSVCVPVFNMLAVLMLTAYSTDGKSISWREEVRQIFRNPLILGALAGLVTVLGRPGGAPPRRSLRYMTDRTQGL